jgi:hypothetical protein
VCVPPRLPSTAQFAVEQVLKQRLVRGHIEALVSLHGTAIDAPALDRERARSAWAELQALRDEIDPAATLPLSPAQHGSRSVCGPPRPLMKQRCSSH